MDFARLILIANAGAFFVTRAKSNLQFTRHHSMPVDRFAGLCSDHVGKPSLAKQRKAFPILLRKVRYRDAETGKELIFLTNNLDVPAINGSHALQDAMAHRVVLPLSPKNIPRKIGTSGAFPSMSRHANRSG